MPYKDPEQQRLWHKAWQQRSREVLAAKARERRRAQPEKFTAQRRARYARSKAEINEKKRARYAEEKDVLNAKRRLKYPATRKAHHESLLARERRYRGAKAAKIHAAARARRAADPETWRAKDRARHVRDRIKRNARTRLFYATHTAQMAEKSRAYRLANPAIQQAHSTRRRAQKAAAPVNDFSAAQWREMQEAFDHRCAYCDKRAKGHLTQDHLTPLSKGGSHTASNIIPACGSCNSRKHVGPVLAPVQPLLLTLAPAQKQ